MSSITLTISYAKNTGLVLSPTELKNIYFTGIPFADPVTGEPVAEETIEFYIDAAQTEIENDLSVKLTRRAYQETRDFVMDDYVAWGFIPTTYPAEKSLSVKGFLNTSLQINYPAQWLVTKSQSEEGMYWRSVQFVPISGPSATFAGSAVFVGITPYINRFSSRMIPNYWTNRYITGFNRIPADLMNAIGRMTAVSMFTLLSDLILGPGIASRSQGIDGLSQSVSTTSSATFMTFSAKIKAYQDELARQRPLLRSRYQGFTFGSF